MKKAGFILLFSFSATIVSSQIVTDSLIAMYSFNNGTAEDDIGPWDGTPVNATLIPDRFGNPDHAYWLNGTPNSYIKLGTTSVLKPAECSISMWMRIDSLITSGTGYFHNILLVTKCQTGNNFYESYALYYNLTTHKIIAVTTNAPANQQVVYSVNQIALHSWYHLVMTFDFQKVKLYVNGVAQGTLLKNYTTVYLPDDSVMIGNSCNPQNSRYYRGAVDDLRFYNRVISPLEADSLFNEPNPGSSVPPVALFETNYTKLCLNDCISFSNASLNASSYEWFFTGATPNFSTLENPPNICYNTAGIYNVKLVVHNGGFSDTLSMLNYIVVYPQVTPVIMQLNDTLIVTGVVGATTYQWYFNNTGIAGATNNYIIESQTGLYSVIVHDGNNCTGSDSLDIINSGVNIDLESGYFKVNPNPTTTVFYLNYSGKNKICSLQLLNDEGKKIWETEQTNQNKWEINSRSFPSGLYFLKIKFTDQTKTIKLYKCD